MSLQNEETARMYMAAKLKEARAAAQMNVDAVGNAVGKSGKTISAWEVGNGQPSADLLIKLCRLYRVPISFFYEPEYSYAMEVSNTDDAEFIEVPLLGSIAAGTPLEMIESEELHPIPKAVYNKHRGAFLLVVKGESMNKKLPNGCYALIDPDAELIDNKVYAVCVNGFDATIKIVHQLANGLELIPDSTDPTYKSQLFDFNDPAAVDITILGRVVWFTVPFDWDV